MKLYEALKLYLCYKHYTEQQCVLKDISIALTSTSNYIHEKEGKYTV